ncbi:putative ribonuclease [Trypanosoma conorhini]|uniref:Putative ribonuclease n=1 Tax=Trypanosoma conorhini TaxID=83891 RepID=A0A422Q8G5_9TRYP|nr:putative ribonuclease [Trypanosoma conorhini]RNF26268.1 putative ribonuclease [Trypanosoma conorhini]
MTSDITFLTRQNFVEMFPAFLRDLHEADYTAVDLEFTGIDRESAAHFLRLPEEAFLRKMAAARQFCPMQIGFSMFRGDTEQASSTAANAPCADAAPQTYRDVMVSEAKAFYPTGLRGPMLKAMLESWASKGHVAPSDVEQLNKARREAELALKGSSDSAPVYEQLTELRTLSEIDAVLQIAERWKGYAEAKRRHVRVRNYSCYLLPAPEKGDGDRTVTLSSETVMFLMKNTMDLNKWMSESLFFVSFEEYLKVQLAVMHGVEAADHARAVDERLEALRQWINAFPLPEAKNQLWSEYNRIRSFACNAAVGESMEANFPFLKPPLFAELGNCMGLLGLRFVRKTITKVSSFDDLDLPIAKDPNYFGTRLLEALVAATQGRKMPLVLHNGLSDLTFLFSAMRQVIPQTLPEFKRFVREIFPVFYDTRTLTCAPSLQKFGVLTGALKKTYLALLKRNERVQIHSELSFEAVTECTMKEHDAVFDAFMTGSLFLFVQEELARVGADFRRLRGVTPIHGCVFSVNFLDDAADCILHPPSAPMFLIQHPPKMSLKLEGLRSKLLHEVESVAFLINGDHCLVKICDVGCDSAKRQQVSFLVQQWCEGLGMGFTPLDVDSRVRAHGLTYLREKAS